MVRNAVIGFAVLAGLGAALLLTLRPTVVVNGETVSCPGVIVTAEARGAGDREPRVQRAACDPVQAQWTWYATGLGLLALVAGTGAAFYWREGELAAVPTPSSTA
jgi:hypothetical protein